MKADTLKKSILQYAMQGKLVAQDPNDEPASELLKRIKAEKEQLIKDGKIKKEKPLPPITEDEIPYELPQSWKWVRLGEVCELYTGNSISKSIKSSKYSKLINGYDYIGTKDITFDNKIIYENGVKIPFTEKKFKYSYKDSVLLCIEGGSAGRKIAISDKQICFGNKLCSFNAFQIIPKFLYFFMQSPVFVNIFTDNKSGIIGGVSITKLKELYFAVPPLAEQQRIVEKLEEILPLVEEYGKNEEILSEMNKKLPKQIRRSILQYAVQGKLVEQDPNDEPASELLKRIKAEKKQLIKDGKIKKEKPLPPITADEIPYELPQGWEWVRLGNIYNIGSAKRVHQSDWRTKGVPFYRAREIGKLADFDCVNNDLFIDEELYNKFSQFGAPKPMDIMVTAVGTLGKAYVVKLTDKFYYKDASVICLHNICCINPYFIKFLLSSPIMIEQISDKVAGTTVGTITIDKANNYIVPLPPLAEQQRIVTKVEELMQIVDKLE